MSCAVEDPIVCGMMNWMDRGKEFEILSYVIVCSEERQQQIILMPRSAHVLLITHPLPPPRNRQRNLLHSFDLKHRKPGPSRAYFAVGKAEYKELGSLPVMPNPFLDCVQSMMEAKPKFHSFGRVQFHVNSLGDPGMRSGGGVLGGCPSATVYISRSLKLSNWKGHVFWYDGREVACFACSILCELSNTNTNKAFCCIDSTILSYYDLNKFSHENITHSSQNFISKHRVIKRKRVRVEYKHIPNIPERLMSKSPHCGWCIFRHPCLDDKSIRILSSLSFLRTRCACWVLAISS